MKTSDYKDFINEHIKVMKESILRDDFKTYNEAKCSIERKVDERKNEMLLFNESKSNNFGILNDIILENVPRLFKTNKKALRDVMKTIREDKNLLSQFNFYNIVEGYDSSVSDKIPVERYLGNAIKLFNKNVDKTTLVESNKRLSNVLVKNGIIPSSIIDESRVRFYNNCGKILSDKGLISESKSVMEAMVDVEKYMADNVKKVDSGSKVDIFGMMEEYSRSNKLKLNEDEQDLVKQITDFKSPVAEERKRKLFNKFKNECINKIDIMIESANSDEKSGLEDIKKELTNKEFCNETIVEDMAKLLEIRDVLFDN